MRIRNIKIAILLVLVLSLSECKKLIQIPPPAGTVTTSQVFATDGQAESAIAGLYFNMINISGSFSSGDMSILGGMSADELVPFDASNTSYTQFEQNDLVATNGIMSQGFWADAYSTIYGANAIIEGLQNYSGVHDSIRQELTGEAEFVRAFCYFYLVNLFGDVPLVTTINWQKTNLLARTPATGIYQQITIDLKSATDLLASDYSVAEGQRIVPNKWAAMALLARVDLYQKDWNDADSLSSAVINNTSLYSLDTLNGVFLANSTEAIWQLQQSNTYQNNATPEGEQLIPLATNSDNYSPFAYVTPQLFLSFENGDQRVSHWLDSTLYNGLEYYFPYKYKIGPGQAVVGGAYSEYYMVLRLGEQYLIRAEAEANMSNLLGAANDLNAIRNRAGLDSVLVYSQGSLLNDIFRERRAELFVEWGQRWLDLKRLGLATSVLQPIKPLWTANAQLYPIPQQELITDPNLVQNAGY